MEDNLKGLLISYKILTEELYQCLKEDKFDEVNNILDKRQKVINKINGISYTREEFSGGTQELDIVQLQNKVNSLIAIKKEEVIEEMKQLLKTKSANKLYNKNLYNNSSFSKRG